MSDIHSTIIKIMGELGAIKKSQVNKQQGWVFRGIDDFYNALQPLMSKHGLYSIPVKTEYTQKEKTTRSGSVLTFTVTKINYRLYAQDGSYVEAEMIGEGMDSGDKSIPKSASICHKYLLNQIFIAPVEEVAKNDPDNYALEKNNGIVNQQRQQQQRPMPPQRPAPQRPAQQQQRPQYQNQQRQG